MPRDKDQKSRKKDALTGFLWAFYAFIIYWGIVTHWHW